MDVEIIGKCVLIAAQALQRARSRYDQFLKDLETLANMDSGSDLPLENWYRFCEGEGCSDSMGRSVNYDG